MLLPRGLPASHSKSKVPPAVGAHRGKYSFQTVLSFTPSQRSRRIHGGGVAVAPGAVKGKVTVACALLPCSGWDSLQPGESLPQLSRRCGAGLRLDMELGTGRAASSCLAAGSFQRITPTRGAEHVECDRLYM